MGFPRQEYWGGLPFPSPGDLPDTGINPRSPALQADALTSEPPGKPHIHWMSCQKILPIIILLYYCYLPISMVLVQSHSFKHAFPCNSCWFSHIDCLLIYVLNPLLPMTLSSISLQPCLYPSLVIFQWVQSLHNHEFLHPSLRPPPPMQNSLSLSQQSFNLQEYPMHWFYHPFTVLQFPLSFLPSSLNFQINANTLYTSFTPCYLPEQSTTQLLLLGFCIHPVKWS